MAKWNEIKDLKDQIEDKIFELKGVNYVDIETEFLDNGELGEAILLVGTKEEQLIPELKEALKPLVGDYEVKVIQFEMNYSSGSQEPINAEGSSYVQDGRDMTKYRPLIGGINIGVGINNDGSSKAAGTLGVFLPSSKNPHSYVGLSNQHVVSTFQSINQPEIPKGTSGPLPLPIMSSTDKGALNANIDANICTFTNYDSFITREVLGIGVIRGSKSPQLNMAVKKVGMMSGLTSGTIISTTSSLKYKKTENGVEKWISLKNQLKIKPSNSAPFQIEGDSGAALLSSFEGDSVNKSACLTGLMWGVDKYKNGYANHIGDVLSQFDLTVDTHVPFYRMFNGTDHFYTTHYYMMNGSGGRSGYTYKKVECYAWATPNGSANLIPLYRLYCPGNGDHLYTTNANERPSNYNYEGIACYVKPNGSTDTVLSRALVPLYRWYNPTTGDHMLTLNINANPAGYHIEGSIGVVMSPTSYSG